MTPFPNLDSGLQVMNRLGFIVLCCSPLISIGAPEDEFFEKKIRPVLVEHCYSCHADGKKEPKGSLRLDSRAALLIGGDSGPAIVPGKPNESKLIEAIRYTNTDLLMPPKSKLSDTAINDLTEWVKIGAPWPGADAKTVKKQEFDVQARKSTHWAWQPLSQPIPPSVQQKDRVQTPIDQFILAELEKRNLKPATTIARTALIRRLYFDLIGLPPTIPELDRALNDSHPQAVSRLIDELLSRPQFGEKWARHWLDLMRYAETKGHEFDFPIPNVHHYRDYIIRAFNSDVPYNQLVKEHLAGDLLPNPRKHPTEKFNESVVGTGFWFLGEELHSPVDIHQDEADRFDNRIDVLTKSFLGMTVSCARCHDHKFDAISTKDYYAMYGMIKSTGYHQVRFDTMDQEKQLSSKLFTLRKSWKPKILASLAEKLAKESSGMPPVSAATRISDDGRQILVDFADASQPLLQDGNSFYRIEAGSPIFTSDPKSPISEFSEFGAIVHEPALVFSEVAPGSASETGKLAAPRWGKTFRSPGISLKSSKLSYLVKGKGLVYAAVGQHALLHGPLHGNLVFPFDTKGKWQWIDHDLKIYLGQRFHIEFTATGTDLQVAKIAAIRDDQQQQVKIEKNPSEPFSQDLLIAKLKANQNIPVAWVPMVNRFLEKQADQPEFAAAQKEILKNASSSSRLTPAIWEGTNLTQYVMLRGSPKGVGEEVPHRFLDALDPKAITTSGSGRLEFADAMIDPKRNPLFARVIVNRVWHQMLGRGIVSSVDNFGVLGEKPTHPELLDWLANWFIADGYHFKHLIKLIALSSVYQQSTVGDPKTLADDAENRLWGRALLRRLPAEAIRDSMLLTANRLNPSMGGPSVPIHLTDFLDGRGRPASGPIDGEGRRSIYLGIKRNFLSPMMQAFDAPIPFSTVGKRSVSNVPAQALILLNDPFVQQQAERLAQRAIDASKTAEGRIDFLFRTAISRPAATTEKAACIDFLAKQANRRKVGVEQVVVWSDLAHIVYNLKEFVYLP
jgi:hypothetical protein